MVIDTGIFIEYLRIKDKTASVLYKIPDNSSLFLSAISMYELHMGATSAEKEKDIRVLTESISVLPFTDDVAIRSARIYHRLKTANQLIEFRDIFIAATCLVNDLPILTLNKNIFNALKG
ncbi:hypothetical protein LX99_00036 [Mucilaginibacter oryzae]|uniref:PIN domain-containing protein n=1 Tax=Mucilaginibacter oryzae TaxID=468058 RepID=A0A316HED8_9SPHI|nr:type II toxin-antitoxin system VapC family toxin [Mucilaginibacter oryzae]PWK79579.1 hypothetical protein LX99_00036 [Mucilaginibacter oryzae]